MNTVMGDFQKLGYEHNGDLTDLDWIFSHGPEVVEDYKTSTVYALAGSLGVSKQLLWGNCRHDLVDLTENMRAVLKVATPFLQAKDKAGWEAHCLEMRERNRRRGWKG